MTTMRLARREDLLGRRIVAVNLRPFADGRGGRAFDPLLVLDDGSTLSFGAMETDVGCYGVRVLIETPAQRRRVRRGDE